MQALKYCASFQELELSLQCIIPSECEIVTSWWWKHDYGYC